MTSTNPSAWTVDLADPASLDADLVGGKGANLARLLQLDSSLVPAGFCVTTHAHRHVLTQADVLAQAADSAALRAAIEAVAIPDDVAAAIGHQVARHGEGTAFAVRSSATAEDLADASFAGQHDSYLNVVGAPAVLEHIRRCWASLHADRAVAYRARLGLDHRDVDMAVVVQVMVNADAAGVAFTTDPATSNRSIVAIEATVGLGEALVSGRVATDAFAAQGDEIVASTVRTKATAVRPVPGGGVAEVHLSDGEQVAPALQPDEVRDLARLARRIEAHLGGPQDIEWCRADGRFHIVQSRPITTLFPLPPAADDGPHVYVSVGHNQMMTDAMTPLGLSVWMMTTPAPMVEAASRLFVDVAPRLATTEGRHGLLDTFGRSDPLIRDALETVLAREGFLPEPPTSGVAAEAAGPAPAVAGLDQDLLDADPVLVARLADEARASIDQARRAIAGTAGAATFDFIAADMAELRARLFDPEGLGAITSGMEASWWLNEHLEAWLGERSAADALSQSAPGNITSEMGLALLDVADAIRHHPQVVAFLREVGDDDGFLPLLDDLDGGAGARAAIEDYLARFGMRCVGEIDIARPRWAERPSSLVPAIVSHVDHFEPGEAARRFAIGQRRAEAAERDVLRRLRQLPDGEAKAAAAKAMIDRVRAFVGYREFPKYAMVCRYHLYRQALWAEATQLVARGVIDDADDIAFLRFDELRAAVVTGTVDRGLIESRRTAFGSHQGLVTPRVLLSDGTTLQGSFRRDDLPDGALAGLSVSAGLVEGRARVVTSIDEADLAPGDILVTTHTDPSWSPVFVTIAGLVTEVGGLMTHGAVVAREYGLPAVVGVERATERIVDGQRIRLDAIAGYVVVDPPA